MFPNAEKIEEFFKHSADPSGNSIVDAVYYEFESGESIDTYCNNYEETFRIKNNWSEGLSVAIRTKETNSWLYSE